MDGDAYVRLLYLGLIAVAVGGWVMVEYRKRLGLALRTAAAWALIILGLMAAYGLWNDISRDITPPRQAVAQSGEISLKRAADGHFYVELMIDATPVFFMVDTGATNMVLSNDDAERLGIDLGALHYLGEAATANGLVRTARVTLGRVELGPYVDEDFRASVTEGQMEGSLLGMDYLRRFSIQIEGDQMILRR